MRLTGVVCRARTPPLGLRAAPLHASCRPETAWLDAQQDFPFKDRPMTICACDVDGEDVLDLADPAIPGARGIAPNHLASPWQADAAAEDINAVVRRWSDVPPHARLLRDASAWR